MAVLGVLTLLKVRPGNFLEKDCFEVKERDGYRNVKLRYRE